jgi:hypothetical protein
LILYNKPGIIKIMFEKVVAILGDIPVLCCCASSVVICTGWLRSEGVPSCHGGTKGAGIKVICVFAGKN